VPIGLAALFGGPPAAAAAAAIAAIYRLVLGGAGEIAGTVGIVLAALCGVFVAQLGRTSGHGLTYPNCCCWVCCSFSPS